MIRVTEIKKATRFGWEVYGHIPHWRFLGWRPFLWMARRLARAYEYYETAEARR